MVKVQATRKKPDNELKTYGVRQRTFTCIPEDAVDHDVFGDPDKVSQIHSLHCVRMGAGYQDLLTNAPVNAPKVKKNPYL